MTLSRQFALSAAVLVTFVAAAAEDSGPQRAVAEFRDAQGREIGTANLTQTPNGVLIELELRGLPPGEHGFHVHETGRCEPESKFESAGGHYAPAKRAHGFLVEEGPHAGDMPNIFVGKDGTVRAHIVNDGITLGPGTATVFDADGSALIVHGKPDDYRSQPSGDAGDRLACAVIERAGR